MFFKHRLLGLFFSFFKLFPLKRDRIVFVVDSFNSFNLSYDNIICEFKKHDSTFSYCFFLKDKLSFKGLFNLATSGFVFLDDNFFPLAFMNFKKDVRLVQLWHAPGAFKRFGYETLKDEESKKLLENIGSKISLLSVTSSNIQEFYSEAFQVSKDKIRAFGFPKLDYYTLDKLTDMCVKDDFVKRFPKAKGKKVVLYAPTFRENSDMNDVFKYLDVNRFNEVLGEDYVLAVRLHPKIDKFLKDFESVNKVLESDNVINLTGEAGEQDLLLACDVLVTDYSSIMIEAVFIDKPVVFFAYDLEDYTSCERGFYFDYNLVPGPIVKDTESLIKHIQDEDYRRDKVESFLAFQFDNRDSNSSKRIVDFLLK